MKVLLLTFLASSLAMAGIPTKQQMDALAKAEEELEATLQEGIAIHESPKSSKQVKALCEVIGGSVRITEQQVSCFKACVTCAGQFKSRLGLVYGTGMINHTIEIIQESYKAQLDFNLSPLFPPGETDLLAWAIKTTAKRKAVYDMIASYRYRSSLRRQ